MIPRWEFSEFPEISFQKKNLAVKIDGTNEMHSSFRLSVQPESICLSFDEQLTRITLY